MRTYQTKALRKGLEEPGFYKSTYSIAKRVMLDYERRLEQLEWACTQLKQLDLDTYTKGRALVVLSELRDLKKEGI